MARRFSRSRAVLVAALVLGAAAGACGPDGRPSVVLISVDTLRADHLGAYGDPRGNSPAVDRLLRQGTAFTAAMAPRGQTWPSLATLLTGQWPAVHGVRRNGLRLPAEARTLAHVLSDAGYDRFAALGNSGRAGWAGFPRTLDARTDDGRVTEGAAAWWRRVSARPRFLWVHFFGPHRPYQPAEPLVRRLDPGYDGAFDGSIDQVRAVDEGRLRLTPADRAHLRARYAAAVRATDRHVQRLLRAVDAEAGGTLVVLLSDHGEELLDRNGYVSHSASVYDSVLRVPLAFRWPGRIPAGALGTGVVELRDVPGAVLALLGVPGAAGFPGGGGITFPAGDAAGAAVPAPGTPPAPGAAPAFSELEAHVVSVRTAGFRYVSNPAGFAFPLGDEGAEYAIGAEELYDLAGDPGERVNVAPGRPADVERLRRAAEQWRTEVGWDEAAHRLQLRGVPDDVRERLEALGYAP